MIESRDGGQYNDKLYGYKIRDGAHSIRFRKPCSNPDNGKRESWIQIRIRIASLNVVGNAVHAKKKKRGKVIGFILYAADATGRVEGATAAAATNTGGGRDRQQVAGET